MGQPKLTCNRCMPGAKTRVSEQRQFTLGQYHYELTLCEEHASMFDRDLAGWTRLATETDSPAVVTVREKSSAHFTEERREETRRIRELRERFEQKAVEEEFARLRAAELEEEYRAAEQHAYQSIPGALKWRLTEHARERMELRGLTIHEVLEAAARPGHTYPDPKGRRDVLIRQKDQCCVVVNTRLGDILTVMDRTLESVDSDTRPKERAAL